MAKFLSGERKTQRVPIVRFHEKSDEIPEEVKLITGIGVSKHTSEAMLILDVEIFNFGRRDGGKYHFALSPSGAAQLARTLDESVQQYLYDKEDE